MICPTRRSPSLVVATGAWCGCLGVGDDSDTVSFSGGDATFVVPRSIPTTFAILGHPILSFKKYLKYPHLFQNFRL